MSEQKLYASGLGITIQYQSDYASLDVAFTYEETRAVLLHWFHRLPEELKREVLVALVYPEKRPDVYGLL